MTNSLHQVRFPGENEQYRSARNELLEAELELRQTLEAVASLRRKLPPGGKIKEDYLFEEISSGSGSEMIKQTKLSGLFVPGKDSLILYSFMFDPAEELACPMCTSFLQEMRIDSFLSRLMSQTRMTKAAVKIRLTELRLITTRALSRRIRLKLASWMQRAKRYGRCKEQESRASIVFGGIYAMKHQQRSS